MSSILDICKNINNIEMSFSFKKKKNNSSNGIRENGLNIYKKTNLFKRLLLSKNERCIYKAISFINTKDYKSAIEVLNNYDKDGNFLVDIYLLNIFLNQVSNKKEAGDEIIDYIYNNEEYIGRFFKKHKIGITTTVLICNNYSREIDNSVLSLQFIFVVFLSKKGNIEKALNILKGNSLENPLFQLILAELYLEIDNYSAAILLLQNICNEGIYTFYSRLLLGRAFRQEGLLKSSIAVLRKTRRRSNGYPDSLYLEGRYQLAVSLEEYNKNHLARKEYEKILTVDYNFKDTRKRIERLKNI